LFAHCFTCGKDVVAAARIARALTERGIAVLRFDFTGLGSSGGDFGNTRFSSNIADLKGAADHLREHFSAPSILIGHSLGGAAVLAATHLIPEVRAVATIGAPADPRHVVGLFDEHRARIEEDGEAEVTLAGRTFRIRRELLEDLAAQPQDARIASLGAAPLVLHSPIDALVGVDHARRVFDTARHPKSFVALDGADHLLTNADVAAFVAAVVATWATRYLPAPAAPAPGTRREGSVVVAGARPSALAQHLTVGPYHLVTDEPVPVGDDTGPTPYASTPRTARTARRRPAGSTASNASSNWTVTSTTISGSVCSRSPTGARCTARCGRRS
jgi:pimeloyl-ACP methyl ester carboxylesterase